MIEAIAGEPWTPAQVRVVLGCDLIGALAIALAALGAGDGALQDQIVWLDVAVLGLVVAVVGNGGLFLAGRRAVGRRRLRLLADVPERTAPLPPTAPADGRWWWLPGTTRAHVAGCQMIAGKPAQEISPDAIRANQLQRCEVCR